MGSIVTSFAIGYFGYAAYEKKHRTISSVSVTALVAQGMAAADKSERSQATVGASEGAERSHSIVEAANEAAQGEPTVRAANEGMQTQLTLEAANEAAQTQLTKVRIANETAQSQQEIDAATPANETDENQRTETDADGHAIREAQQIARAAEHAAERRRSQTERVADMA
ncbi:hypothetical protein B0A55_06086 [Friedmanniomyces simplex]|uniref:Uncharacterized protein n=1 Tax=Friedmanniomyces simplex TaxID=329884 RepID=A0A4U0XCB9_9PEZI|nr:hypothetical protein B0A55_06086 [Friedmanniomyces simplex]